MILLHQLKFEKPWAGSTDVMATRTEEILSLGLATASDVRLIMKEQN